MHDERSSDMKMMILAAMLAVCGFIAAAADVRGVYKLAGERRLILVERGQAVIRDGARFSQYGSWSVERVEGMERVVMRLWDKDQWQLEMKPRVWLFDILPDGKGLVPRGVGDGTLEAAVKCMKEQQNGLDEPPVMALVPDAYSDAVAVEVSEAIAKVDAPVQAAKAQRRIDAAKERIKKDPKLLRKVRFSYPKVDPEESAPDGETLHMLYSPEMRMVFDILWDTGITIDKETLIDMLDRVDWERGDVLAFWILGRGELDASVLREYAPKALAHIGKTDKYLLRKYFNHPNLPTEVRESAHGRGWAD